MDEAQFTLNSNEVMDQFFENKWGIKKKAPKKKAIVRIKQKIFDSADYFKEKELEKSGKFLKSDVQSNIEVKTITIFDYLNLQNLSGQLT